MKFICHTSEAWVDFSCSPDDGRAMFDVVLWWEATKDWLSASTGLTHHDFHLILGVSLTLALTRLLRLPLGSWRPLLIVFGLEMLNEVSDFTRYYVSGWPWTPWPTLYDIAITVLPALAITLAARRVPTR